MAQLLFVFTLNTETNETIVGGNIEPQMALQILQQIVIAEAIKESARQNEEKSATIETKEEENVTG